MAERILEGKPMTDSNHINEALAAQSERDAIRQLGDSILARQQSGDHSAQTFRDGAEYERRSDAHNASERQRLRRTRDQVGQMLRDGRSQGDIDQFIGDSGFKISEIRQANRGLLDRYGFLTT
jgi:hypothetical protein